MSAVSRAMIYLSRKKGKTVCLFILVFGMSVFLISGFCLLYVSGRLQKVFRTSVGAAFYIRAKTDVITNEKGETEIKENSVHITQKEIDKIMQLEDVQDYNPVNYGFVKSNAIEFLHGEKHTEENNMGRVIGLRDSSLATDFTDGVNILIQGNHITQMDTAEILLSETLAKSNHISVGDTVQLTHAKFEEKNGNYQDAIPVKTLYLDVTVAGIYKRMTEDTAIKPTAGIKENDVYASLDVLECLQESEKGVYTGEVDFYISDPNKLERVTGSVRQLKDIDWSTHFIRTNDFQYKKVAGQLESFSRIVKLLLLFVSVVSTVVLILLLVLRMRGRVLEAGVLLSTGISKKEILFGFLLEVWVVTGVAMAGSYIVVQTVISCLRHGQLYNGISYVALITKNIKLNKLHTFFIYLIQLLVISLSTFFASGIILKLKPKDILTKQG